MASNSILNVNVSDDQITINFRLILVIVQYYFCFFLVFFLFFFFPVQSFSIFEIIHPRNKP